MACPSEPSIVSWILESNHQWGDLHDEMGAGYYIHRKNGFAKLNGFDVDKFEYLTGRITAHVLLVNEILSVELY